MKTVLVILLLVSSILAGHHGKHKCIHDTISQRWPNREETIFEIPEEERNLQSAKPARNMKFTYDLSFFSYLTNSTADQKFNQIAIKALDTALQYFSQLLTIVPKPENMMKFDKQNLFCNEAPVPESDINDDKDSDLHIYITFSEEPQDSYLAYAGWCRFIKNYGATHGHINFNKGYIQRLNLNDPTVYQDFIQTTIHEITHILGFSQYDYHRWVDTKTQKQHKQPTIKQQVRGEKITFIKTPNVLAAAQQYYNCSSIPGMPLENQGGMGNAGHHWETIAILDEMMNPAASATNAIMSIFTIALLKDTGYYASVNEQMAEPSFYGKNKGCDFILGAGPNKQQKEFCTAEQPETQSCDFYSHSIATCRAHPYADAGYNNYYPIQNSRCFDTNNYLASSQNFLYLGVGFGHNSKCFMSSLYYSGSKESNNQPLCYQYECTEDNIVNIKVGAQTAVCTTDGEKVSVPGYTGTLSCPDNIRDFCGFKKLCPRHCSSNGYCVNGTCMCSKGYSGVDCSIQE